MLRIIRVAAGCGVVVLLVVLQPLAASAHETREVAGGYEVVVGFIDEPAFVGEKNGLFFEVTNPAAAATPAAGAEEGEHGGAPVLGLADTLQAEVIYGEETMELELVPSFSQPGAYLGYFFPMAEGDYTFRIFGEIAGNAIDESFTSSPEGFDAVQPREPLEFPKEESARAGDGAAAGLIGDRGGSAGSGRLAVGLAALTGAAGLWLVRQRAATHGRSAALAAAPVRARS